MTALLDSCSCRSPEASPVWQRLFVNLFSYFFTPPAPTTAAGKHRSPTVRFQIWWCRGHLKHVHLRHCLDQVFTVLWGVMSAWNWYDNVWMFVSDADESRPAIEVCVLLLMSSCSVASQGDRLVGATETSVCSVFIWTVSKTMPGNIQGTFLMNVWDGNRSTEKVLFVSKQAAEI